MDSDEFKLIGRQIEEFQRFIYQLGALTFELSQTEGAVYKVVLKYAGISEDVGRSLLSGARAAALCDCALALLDNIVVDDRAAKHLRFVLAQFSAINTARNDLVHHATNAFNTQGIVVSTATRAKRRTNGASSRVKSDTLQLMVSDLSDIKLHLSIHLRPGKFFDPPPAWPATWRYKSSRPKNSQAPTRKTAHKQKGRPAS